MKMIKKGYTFRNRMPEWVLSLGILAWGILCLVSDGLFVNSYYFHTLLLIMNQAAWGAVAVTTGVVRLLFLFVNGAWRPSAHIRAAGCVAGCLIWGSLFIASLSLSWVSPNTALFAALLLLDVLSLWFVAGDAKVADVIAKTL